jgi:hypothetical protein
MIYKFKSKAAGDVIMTGVTGDHILRLLGREPSPQGILLPEAMPAAIAALEQAVRDDEDARRQAEQEAAAAGETLPPREGVSLRQRVWPLIEMLRRCHAADREVVWGV